jgi:hypothetical protein
MQIVDGTANTVYEADAVAEPEGPENVTEREEPLAASKTSCWRRC